MHLMDGSDKVHLRTITRHALRQPTAQAESLSAYFTMPEPLWALPQIR